MGKALLINPVDGAQLLLEDSVLLGSAPDCGVPLPDMTVAGHHASLNLVGENWYLSPLDGEVKIDFHPVSGGESVQLREGSSIQLGRIELFFTQDPNQIAAFENMGDESYPTPEEAAPAPEPYYPPESEAVQPPFNPPPVPQKQKKAKKGSGPIIAIISVAAALILVLGWCLLFHLKGNSRMKAEDFPAAISAYQKDFLFGRGAAKEAIAEAGQRAFDRKDFASAIDYFERLGEDGQARWSDSVYAYALQLIEEGRPEEAIEQLDKISTEERAAEQKGVAQLAIAKKLFDAGNYEGAIAAAKEVVNTRLADPTPILNASYLRLAAQYLRAGREMDALNALESCVGEPKADANAEALRALMTGALSEGAKAAQELIANGQSELTRSEWLDVLERQIDAKGETSDNLDERLDREAARAILGDEMEVGGSAYESLVRDRTSADMVGSYSGVNESWYTVSSLDDLYSQCGTNPQGKILIVCERHSYPDRNESYAVRFDLMELLPAERYPSSLSEVEYVMLISYDFSKDGTYDNYITTGVRENVRIYAYRMPDKNRVEAGNSLHGAHSPDTITIYGAVPPSYYSGGVPDVTDEFVSILSKLLAR